MTGATDVERERNKRIILLILSVFQVSGQDIGMSNTRVTFQHGLNVVLSQEIYPNLCRFPHACQNLSGVPQGRDTVQSNALPVYLPLFVASCPLTLLTLLHALFSFISKYTLLSLTVTLHTFLFFTIKPVLKSQTFKS